MLNLPMADNDKHGDEGTVTGVVVKAKPKTKKPSMYKVLMLNDDYTPMEFVVLVLERFFNKNRGSDADHVARASAWRRYLRSLHLRGSRNEGDPGDGLCPPTPASFAMHPGEGLARHALA